MDVFAEGPKADSSNASDQATSKYIRKMNKLQDVLSVVIQGKLQSSRDSSVHEPNYVDIDAENIQDSNDENDNGNQARPNNLSIPADENKRIILEYREEYDSIKKIDKEIFSGKGLRNLGNTCFFNSIMQCLIGTRDLYFAYKDDSLDQTGKGFYFNDTFRDFLNEMRASKRDAVSPSDLFSAITRKISRFRGYQQQDAHDLLMNLFELLENEATKKEKNPIVTTVFGGEMCSSVLCLTCNQVSRTIDEFNNLTLDIAFKTKSQTTLMKSYCQNLNVMSIRDSKKFVSIAEGRSRSLKEREDADRSSKTGLLFRLFCC